MTTFNFSPYASPMCKKPANFQKSFSRSTSFLYLDFVINKEKQRFVLSLFRILPYLLLTVGKHIKNNSYFYSLSNTKTASPYPCCWSLKGQGRSQELEMGGAKLLGEGYGGRLRPPVGQVQSTTIGLYLSDVN